MCTVVEIVSSDCNQSSELGNMIGCWLSRPLTDALICCDKWGRLFGTNVTTEDTSNACVSVVLLFTHQRSPVFSLNFQKIPDFQNKWASSRGVNSR